MKAKGPRFFEGLVALTLMAGASAVSIDCEQIIGIPDRATRTNVVCVKGSCACAPGFGDCDGTLANGCEVDLSTDQGNCGACGAVCANGACASAECACNAGYSDCDSDLGNGCESELATSPTSCGACGHDCLGGGCQASLCTPALVATSTSPFGILLSGGNLFYLERNGGTTSVFEVFGGTGSPRKLSVVNAPLLTLAVAGSTVFASSSTDLYRIDGSVAKIVHSVPVGNTIEDVAASDSTVFVMSFPGGSQPGQIDALDAATTTSTAVYTDVDLGNFSLTLSRGQPVWINTSLGVSTVVGGVAGPVANGPMNVIDLAADDSFVFAVQFTNKMGLTRIDMDTGAMLVAAPVPSTYGFLTANGPTLVWTDNSEAIDQWDGASVVRLAQGLHIDSHRIAMDAVAVYLATADGHIIRIAR